MIIIFLSLTLRDIESHSSAFSALFSYAFPTLATKSLTVSQRTLDGKEKTDVLFGFKKDL